MGQFIECNGGERWLKVRRSNTGSARFLETVEGEPLVKFTTLDSRRCGETCIERVSGNTTWPMAIVFYYREERQHMVKVTMPSINGPIVCGGRRGGVAILQEGSEACFIK